MFYIPAAFVWVEPQSSKNLWLQTRTIQDLALTVILGIFEKKTQFNLPGLSDILFGLQLATPTTPQPVCRCSPATRTGPVFRCRHTPAWCPPATTLTALLPTPGLTPPLSNSREESWDKREGQRDEIREETPGRTLMLKYLCSSFISLVMTILSSAGEMVDWLEEAEKGSLPNC